MKIDGKHYRTIWENPYDTKGVQIIDQRHLPHEFVIENLDSLSSICRAISDMHVRGAPLIGATAAYGMYLAALNAHEGNDYVKSLESAAEELLASRPTAVNLAWAVNEQLQLLMSDKCQSKGEAIDISLAIARRITENDVKQCRKIGEFGAGIIKNISAKKNGEAVNILTHCNAGWLATVDYGTATAPIYEARDQGIPLHVWVDETRPRNQGAKLTAWELGHENIPHTLIVDNAGGHLMQHGMVDIVIVGSDRTTYTGDVANKIGTYLKALAAQDNNIPFYVALPSSTIDWEMEDGVKEIPIESRDADEVRYVDGWHDGEVKNILVPPENTPAANYAFDVTPRKLVTGLITERGICRADKDDILRLFSEKMQ